MLIPLLKDLKGTDLCRRFEAARPSRVGTSDGIFRDLCPVHGALKTPNPAVSHCNHVRSGMRLVTVVLESWSGAIVCR